MLETQSRWDCLASKAEGEIMGPVNGGGPEIAAYVSLSGGGRAVDEAQFASVSSPVPKTRARGPEASHGMGPK